MERMLTRTELAEQLGVTTRSVDRMVARGQIRVHRVGHDPRFLWSEILEDTKETPVSLSAALSRAGRRGS